MKVLGQVILLFGFLFASTQLAFAYPQINPYWSGAYFYIDASNNEDRAYSCTFNYTIEYSDFGDRKTQNFSGTFGVAPKSSGNVHKNVNNWVNPSIVGGKPEISCR